jgi:hypothetical protein
VIPLREHTSDTRCSYGLYVRTGKSFQRALDALVIERAQQLGMTYRLYKALKMHDVELLDHIIVGGMTLSFQDHGCMKEPWLALRSQGQ